MWEWLCSVGAHTPEATRGCQIPWSWSFRPVTAQHWRWEPSLGPVEDQELWTTESSLHPRRNKWTVYRSSCPLCSGCCKKKSLDWTVMNNRNLWLTVLERKSGTGVSRWNDLCEDLLQGQRLFFSAMTSERKQGAGTWMWILRNEKYPDYFFMKEIT